jgi:AcrR family transcriptional regulator
MTRKAGGNGKKAAAGIAAGAAYEEKHLELLRAAASAIARHGYHNTSMRDLARAAGRSLSGLYYYFSGKEELLFQIQHHCYSTLLDIAREALAGVESPREKLLVFISHHIGFFRRNMDEMKVLAHEDLTLTGEYGARILEIKREYSQILIDIMAEYEAEVSPASSSGHPSAEMAAFILFGAMNWLYTWPRRLRKLPAEELAAAVAQVFLCGYPECPAPALAGMRDSIFCSPQRFWKQGRPGPRASVEKEEE